MRSDKEMRKNALRIGIALTAGIFSIMPSVSAAPVLNEGSGARTTAGVTVAQSTEGSIQVTDVNGSVKNNVVDWQDFSVKETEKVRFDNGNQTNNYLNIVTGENTSRIDGAIAGGKNVYIVNPNGVIFGNSATVDVGSLYVSSRPISETDLSNIATNNANNEDMTPLANTVSMSGTAGDVINMGTVNANTVYVEGGKIILADVDRISATGTNVTVNNIGSSTSTTFGRSVTNVIAGTSPDTAGTGYSYTGSASKVVSIKNETELRNVSTAGLGRSYMLVDDITLTGNYTPIGVSTAFTGTFDGMFHTVKNINISSGTYGGLFGRVSGATIKNVGVSGGSIKANNAGGIAGMALNNSQFSNVYNESTAIQTASTSAYAGGLIGTISGGTIDSAYNKASVSGALIGGIAGQASNVTITNVYNTGATTYGFAARGSGNTIKYSYTTLNNYGTPSFSYTKTNVYENASSTSASSYSGFSISAEGGGSSTWRIYEGQTMPLLRSFLKANGTVKVNYDYIHGSESGSNNGANLTSANLTYNGSYVTVNGEPAYTGMGNLDSSKIYYSNTSVKDAKTKAMFYTNQQGYDLVGNNVSMAKRTVSVNGADVNVTKTYDGVADVTNEFKTAFNNSSGLSTSGGILAGDSATVTFSNDFTATFNDKNVDDNKPITFTGSLTLNDSSGNYQLDSSSSDLSQVTDATGSIKKRSLNLTINPTSGINKTYDGSSTVLDTYAPGEVISLDTSNPLTAGSTAAKSTTVGLISGDTVSLDSDNSTAYYVDTDNVTRTAHAGDHKVLYDGIRLAGASAGNYQLQYTAAGDTTATVVTNDRVLLDGTINRRLILEDSFVVKTPRRDSNNNIVRDEDNNIIYDTANGSKVYDGTSTYTVPADAILSTDTSASGDTGLIDDIHNLWFELSSTANSYFRDASGNETDMVANATNIAYQVKAVGDADLASNYKLGTVNNSVNLETTMDIGNTSGTPYSVSGVGSITRRPIVVSTNIVTDINKEYNGTNAVIDADQLSMGNGYLDYADGTVDARKLLLDSSETAEDTARWNITGTYDNKNVVRGTDGNAAPNSKNVTYNIRISGVDATNYTLNGTNAEDASVTVHGTGMITPVNLTPTFTTITKTYSGTRLITDGNSNYSATSPNGTVTGITVGDTADDVYLSYSADNARFDSKNAGTNRVITYRELSLAGADSGNYNLTNSNGELISEATGSGVINKRSITAADITPTFSTIAKTYDNTTTIANYADKLTSLTVNNVTNDNLEFTVTSGAFANANRLGGQDLQENGVNYTISLTDENQLSNYILGDGLSGNSLTLTTDGYIYQKPITVTITGSPTKVYDGTDAVTTDVNTLMTIDGIIDNRTTNATIATYDGVNAGAHTVTYNLALNEQEGNNYKFVDSTNTATTISSITGTGEITKRPLTVSFGEVTNVYYGDYVVTANITPTVTNAANAADKAAIEANLTNGLTGLYGSLDTSNGTFTPDSNVGDKDVQYSNLNTAMGTNYNINYEFASDTGYGAGEITQAGISMSNFVFNFADVNKEYDGDNQVEWTTGHDFVTDHYIDLGTSRVNFDYTINSATYDNKNANTGKQVTYNITITQPNLNNFNITNFNAAYFNNKQLYVGTITPKPVYPSAVGTIERTYNSDTDVTPTGNALVNIDGLLSGDTNVSTAVYADPNQGQNKTVNYTISINDGNNGGNYAVYPNGADSASTTFSTTGNIINPKSLQLTFASVTKDYDGGTSVPADLVSYTLNPSDIQGSDVVDIASYSANYNSPNVNEATTITYDNIVLSGNDNGNYVLVGSDGTTPLAAGTTEGNKTTGAGNIQRYVLTEAPTFTLSDITKEYDTNALVSYNGSTALDDVKNYVTSSTVRINGVDQQLPFEMVSANYLGATTAEAAAADDNKTAEIVVRLNNANIDFGTYVTNGGRYTLHNTDAGINTTAAITRRKVYANFAENVPVINKTYDGNTNVLQNVTNAIVLRDGDLLNDGTYLNRDAIDAQYDTKDWGTNKEVTYNVVLGGSAAANYEIHRLENYGTDADTEYNTLLGTGSIDKAALTLTPEAINKFYDGSAAVGDGTAAGEGALTAAKLKLVGVNGEEFYFTDAAFANVAGQYGSGTSVNDFTPDENVSWNGDAVVNKAVKYTGLSTALAVMSNDDVAKNYTIDDSVVFAASQSKGKIKPLEVTAVTESWKPVIREYNADTDLNQVYDHTGGTQGEQLGIQDILQLNPIHNGNSVTDANGNALLVTYTAAGKYDNKNVGGNHVLKYHLNTVEKKITDADGNANYVLSDTVLGNLVGQDIDSEAEGVRSAITKRQLNASVLNAEGNRKIYDGLTAADTSNFQVDDDDLAVLTMDGLLDNLEITANYNERNASANPNETTNNRTIHYTLSLDDNSGNYEVVTPTGSARGDIERRKVSVVAQGITGINKGYDGDATLPSGFNIASHFSLAATDANTGIIAGEEDIQLDVDAIGGSYENKHAGNKNISFSNFTLKDSNTAAGGSKDNYYMTTNSITGQGTISPKALSVGIKAAPVKGYDAYKALSADYASLDNLAYLSGVLGTDEVNLQIDAADYADAAADTGKEYAYAISIDNTDYKLEQGSGVSVSTVSDDGQSAVLTAYDGIITKRKVYVSLADTPAIVKTYDGDTGVEQDVTDKIIVREGDLLTSLDGTGLNRDATAINARYDTKDVGTGKKVTYDVALTGSAAGNYEIHRLDNIGDAAADTIYSTLEGTGDINKAVLTLNPTAISKTYNGTAVVGDGTNDGDEDLTADKLTLVGVNNESFQFTPEALRKVSGQYGYGTGTDDFKADANVSWNGEDVAHKDLLYTGLSDALDVMNSSDSTNSISKNYTIANTAYFAAAQAKGKIKPITITQAATANWKPVVRQYNADTDLSEVYDYSGGTQGEQLGINDILQLTVHDKDGNLLTVDYDATANFDDMNVGDKHVLNYHIDSVNKKVNDSTEHANYVLDKSVLDELAGQNLNSSASGKYSVITPRVLSIASVAAMNKVYDGTTDGVENAEANISLSNYIPTDDLGFTAVATYDNANAGISEDSDELVNHKVTYTLSLSNKNYQLEDSAVEGTGTISRKGLTVVATPVTVNNGEAMPEFSGTVEGLVDKDSNLAGIYTFAPLGTTTTNIPGSFEVYGWYNDRISGNLGLNYTFVQDAGNETAFTVNYVNTNNGNPDTKITPNSDVYQQISKDMSSGFGDNGAAAIEYRDKSGNVIAMETIDSGEIHESGLMSEANGNLTDQDTKLANIGIVGGDIVNIEGADAASTADIQVSGDGTVINLEVVSVKQEENEDKIEAQDKEGEIAIESSDNKDEDEIELKIEGEGVNVA